MVDTSEYCRQVEDENTNSPEYQPAAVIYAKPDYRGSDASLSQVEFRHIRNEMVMVTFKIAVLLFPGSQFPNTLIQFR